MKKLVATRIAGHSLRVRHGLSLLATLATIGLVACGPRDEFPESPVRPSIAAPAPSTLHAWPAESNGPKAKPDVADLGSIPVSNPELGAILSALQKKDDAALAAFPDADELFCPPLHCSGNAVEPSEETSALIGLLAKLIHAEPAIAAHLGEYAERQKDDDRAAAWYSRGYSYGSLLAEERLVALAARSSEYLEVLIEAYAGEFSDSPSRDTAKAARHLSSGLLTSDPQVRERLSALADKLIKRNGPDVAAASWPLLLPAFDIKASSESVAEALKLCLENGGNPDDPASGPGANESAAESQAEEHHCVLALKADPKHSRAWEHLAWALEKQGKPLHSGIAYARAAELGSASAIAAYWRVRAPVASQRSIDALKMESAAGNPWGDFVLAELYRGQLLPTVKDSKLRAAHLRTAAAKGIPAAQNYLGLVFFERKEFTEARGWFSKAAIAGEAAAMFNIASLYENGQGVERDTDTALRWYRRASKFGFKGADEKIAALTTPKTASNTPATRADSREPPAKSPAAEPSGTHVPIGSIVCENPVSFFKVGAIERSGNRYVPFPDDCATMPSSMRVTEIRRGDGVVLVSTGAVTFYVRSKDLRQ